MKRGEIWWAELAHPAGKRPVVLLSRDESYAVRDYIIIAPLTTMKRHILSEVNLGPQDGLPKPCVANLDIINTIPKSSLQERITSLRPEKIKSVEVALHFSLGLEM